MKNATRAIEQIVAAFQSGNVPRPLAQVFIQRGDVPMDGWSYLNKFMCIWAGCTDARGFKQWQQAGRRVKKGEKARAWILVPLMKRGGGEEGETAGGEEDGPRLVGFRESAVFDVSQTEGEPLPEQQTAQAFIDDLPLIEAAKRFGLDVTLFGGRYSRALGYYSRGRKQIGLSVENLSTWLHELVHAADDKLGNLVEEGQHWASETVAELGGATLGVMLGMEEAADVGGAWEYIQRYATAAGVQPVTACMRVLERTAAAIQFILDTAQAAGEESEVAQ